MGGPFYFSIIGRIGSRDRENRFQRGSRRFVRAERTASDTAIRTEYPGMVSGCYPTISGSRLRRSRSQVAAGAE